MVKTACTLLLIALFSLPFASVAQEPSRVHILGTGGTISGTAPERIQLSGYRSGTLLLEEMLVQVPEAHDVARITFEQIVNVGSGSITDAHLLALSNRIMALLQEEPEVDGFVVTHGTGTLEQTAYFLHLTVPTDKPIVVVGSMRPFSAVSTDAHLNLYNAVRVAADPGSRGKGVLIVLNDEINGAREGTKTDTYRVETFTSREFGVLGYADPDRVVFYREPLHRHTLRSEFRVEGLTHLPTVAIVSGGYQMADPTPLAALLEAGTVDGIVLASGAGAFGPLLEEARKAGIAVVQSDAKGAGRVLLNLDRTSTTGIVSSDNLRPQKALILLKLALTQTRDPLELQRIFDTY